MVNWWLAGPTHNSRLTEHSSHRTAHGLRLTAVVNCPLIHSPLPTTYGSRLTAHSSRSHGQFTAHTVHSPHSPRLAAHGSQPTAHDSRRTTHRHNSQLTTHNSQLTTHGSRLTAHSSHRNSSHRTAHIAQLTAYVNFEVYCWLCCWLSDCPPTARHGTTLLLTVHYEWPLTLTIHWYSVVVCLTLQNSAGWMLKGCWLHAEWLLIECWLNADWILNDCSLCANDCRLGVEWMLNDCWLRSWPLTLSVPVFTDCLLLIV